MRELLLTPDQEHEMIKKRVYKESLWRDIGDLRLPSSNWRLGRAANWWATRLGLPKGSVVFLRPNGKKARADKVLKALRREWSES
jgi:hypothetical protein